MIRKILTLGTLAMVNCSAAYGAGSSVTIGRIVSLTKATVESSVKSSVPGPLRWGDVIATGPGGVAKIVLYPAVALTLGPSTTVRMIGNIIQKSGQSVLAEGAIRLVSGLISGHLEKLGVEQKFKIFSPRSFSSIRGTTFSVSAGENDSALLVEEGVVEVTDLASEKVQTVSEGEGLEVSDGNPEMQEMPKSQVSKLTKATLPKTPLLKVSEVQREWNRDSVSVLSEQQKEIAALQTELQSSIKETMAGLRMDAQKIRDELKKDQGDIRNWIKGEKK